MLTKSTSGLSQIPSGFTRQTLRQHMRPSLWQVVALVSFAAGVGNGWRVLFLRLETPSPLTAATATMLTTFAGWYVWGFFTHLTDVILFGGHSDYRATLHAFGCAYIFQLLLFFGFVNPLGWLSGWIALYLTVAAWGIIGPRQLGMRSWQAVAAATLGLTWWLACLLILTLTLTRDGSYIGWGAFLG
jgi:hypothetical protein